MARTNRLICCWASGRLVFCFLPREYGLFLIISQVGIKVLEKVSGRRHNFQWNTMILVFFTVLLFSKELFFIYDVLKKQIKTYELSTCSLLGRLAMVGWCLLFSAGDSWVALGALLCVLGRTLALLACSWAVFRCFAYSF